MAGKRRQSNIAPVKAKLDVPQCVRQHNELMEQVLSIDPMRKEYGGDINNLKTWWETFGAECDNLDIIPHLIPELVEFLKGVKHLPLGGSAKWPNLFYYIRGLALPTMMLDKEYFPETLRDQDPPLILLYQVTPMKQNPCGILFNQKTMTATVVYSTDEHDEIAADDREWLPLHEIFAVYFKMIEVGKVVLAKNIRGSDQRIIHFNDEKSQQFPWILEPHSELHFQRTLRAWAHLLFEIEKRMTDVVPTDPPECYDKGGSMKAWVETLVAVGKLAADGFLAKFLDKFATPSKKSLAYIAPGILRPTVDTLRVQFFGGFDHRHSAYRAPFLLFPAGEIDKISTRDPTVKLGCYVPFRPPFYLDPKDQPIPNKREACPSGLYMSEQLFGGPEFDDTCKLLLREDVVQHDLRRHCAQTTDGHRLFTIKGGLAAGLYQRKYNPFLPNHDVQLFRILEHWTQMVRQGHWTVDKNGVSTPVGQWKDADGKIVASKWYRIEAGW